MNKNRINSVRLYNTPLEIATRMLIILSATSKRKRIDMDRIMYIDYLSLNTADIGGPESLHAPIPNRGVQVYAKKDLIRKGLTILLSKELIDVYPGSQGFEYSINGSGIKFLEHFHTEYFLQLVENTKWVTNAFNDSSNVKLKNFIDTNIQNWGGELFSIEKS